MKRLISIALVVVMAAVILVGCGSSADPVGKYKLKTIDGKPLEDAIMEEVGDSLGDMSLEDVLDVLGMESLDDYMTLDIKSDGTAVLTIPSEGDNSGTWTQSGNKLTITIQGEDAEFTIDGSELKTDAFGEDYVFIKK